MVVRTFCLTCLALCLGPWMLGEAGARFFRPGQIPNGPVNSCSNCHMSPFGGDARNLFGQTVEANFLSAVGEGGQVLWGPELAALDADGDGFTNGEELGDPQGDWKAGDENPGDPEAVTKPWDAESHPPEPARPTAVEATSWARIKEIVGAVLD
jgi:hypothetical protein